MKNLKKAMVLLACCALTLFILCACGGSDTESLYTAGTYTASAEGSDGDITLTVEFSDKKIVSITADHNETPDIGAIAIEQLIDDAIDAQSADVDVVSGATTSSNAFLTALQDCIDQAKG